MGYYINLETISLDEYSKRLPETYLPPSRRILLERIKERFDYFKKHGFSNLKEIQSALKKKDKLEELLNNELFKDDYLKILLREINSMLPKPNKLADFPNINQEAVIKLEKIGLNNTAKLYPKVLTQNDRDQLSKEIGVKDTDILELTKLTDLSRIKWVGATFARMLYDLGIDCVEKAQQTDPVELHKRINELNNERNYFKCHIGLNDMRIFVKAAGDVPLEIVY